MADSPRAQARPLAVARALSETGRVTWRVAETTPERVTVAIPVAPEAVSVAAHGGVRRLGDD